MLRSSVEEERRKIKMFKKTKQHGMLSHIWTTNEIIAVGGIVTDCIHPIIIHSIIFSLAGGSVF